MGSQSSGLILIVVSLILVAGTGACFISESYKDYDSLIPAATYSYDLTEGIVTHHTDGSNPLEGYTVTGTMDIIAYYRDRDMIFGMVLMNASAEGEYYLRSGFYDGWYFDDRMGDKDIAAYSLETIDTIDGEKRCITYIEDALTTSGFKIKFYVDRDACVIYRVLVQTISEMKDYDNITHDVAYIFSVYDLIDYDVQKGKFIPCSQVQVLNEEATGVYSVFDSDQEPLIIDTVGRMTVDRVGVINWNGEEGHAYIVKASMSGSGVSYSMQHFVMLDSEGNLLNGINYDRGWDAMQYNWIYYMGTTIGQERVSGCSLVIKGDSSILSFSSSHAYYDILEGTNIQTVIMTAEIEL